MHFSYGKFCKLNKELQSTDVCYPIEVNTIYLLRFRAPAAATPFSAARYNRAIVKVSCNTCALPRYKSSTHCEKRPIVSLKVLHTHTAVSTYPYY